MSENHIENKDPATEDNIILKDSEAEQILTEVGKKENHWINFEGKRALVTGAGKGIGKSVAIRLAECGAEVFAISRTQSDLDELEKFNDNIKTILLDVEHWDETKTSISNLGDIDLLVNNAGVAKLVKFGDITEEDIDEIYNINVKAIINISQIVAKGMIDRGKGGSIVNVSSAVSFQASSKGNSVYSSSKSSVDQLTRCMATELGPYDIRVNAVNPGVVRTQMSENLFDPNNEQGKTLLKKTPLRRFGAVDDVAFPIVFLLSDYASFINGVTLTIDGGSSVVFY